MKKIILGILVIFSLSNNMYAENIHPITREMGSGTRGAFVEIFGIQKEIKGKKVDAISQKAEVTNSTGVMITSIANSKNAIGYISLGSLKDNVKALKIDGVYPNLDTIINKSYKISRPFNLVTKQENDLIKDFLDYAINAKDIIEKAGYVATKQIPFISKKPNGKLIIAGSSSIYPLIEKITESYRIINPNANIEVLQSDSTTGINAVLDGTADIGMVSRELKPTEIKRGIKTHIIAIDGLAVIVNKANKVDSITKEDIKKIFLGEIKQWGDLK